jgi:streptogramin lyase
MGDHMVFDENHDYVWIFECHDGYLLKFRAEDGEQIQRFNPGCVEAEQLLYDPEEDALWLVRSEGYAVWKFTPEGQRVLEIKEEGRLTPMAIDYRNDSLVFGYYDSATRATMVRRYTRAGTLTDEFPTTLPDGSKPKLIAVNPASRNIWISDRYTTEIYEPDGTFVRALSDKGFVVSDFDDRGTTFFGIDYDGNIRAIRVSDYRTLWTDKTAFKDKEFSAIEYSGK